MGIINLVNKNNCLIFFQNFSSKLQFLTFNFKIGNALNQNLLKNSFISYRLFTLKLKSCMLFLKTDSICNAKLNISYFIFILRR